MARLAHIKITVTNYNKSKKFYDLLFEKLGWKIYLSDEIGTGYSSEDNYSFWVSEGDNRNSKFNRENVGLDHIAFKAKDKKEVDEFAKWLKANKIPIQHEPKYWPEYADDYYAVFFLDPDGIILELTTCD